jgi:hypothetical protein
VQESRGRTEEKDHGREMKRTGKERRGGGRTEKEG